MCFIAIYVTPIRPGDHVSRIRYVSDMDTLGIRRGYVSIAYRRTGPQWALKLSFGYVSVAVSAQQREERGEIREQRGALAGKTDLPACLRKRVRPRRREKLLPPSLRLPLPSSPSARGVAVGRLLFPRRLLWSSIRARKRGWEGERVAWRRELGQLPRAAQRHQALQGRQAASGSSLLLGKRGHLLERREDEEDRAAGKRSGRSWGRSGKRQSRMEERAGGRRLVAAAALRCGRGAAARENGAGCVVCVAPAVLYA